MKNKLKVKLDRIHKIELNPLRVKEYRNDSEILCQCTECNYEFINNYRNLSYKNFQCSFCEIHKSSILVQTNVVKVLGINGSKIELICDKGHIYSQDRRNLLKGKKCLQCYLKSKKISKENLISKFREMHGDFFTYDLKDFKNLHSKINIKCRKGHEFYQKASNHLQGKGCPSCNQSLGERVIEKYLLEKEICFVKQKKFKDCKFVLELPFDFYLPELNILIEFDGHQHFNPVKAFGGEKEFIKTIQKDKIKTEYSMKNQIKLIRIAYFEDIVSKLTENIQENIIFKS